jgi:hypothetical protein
MKKNIKICIAISVIVFGAWFLLINNKGPQKKSSNFKSYQKEMPNSSNTVALGTINQTLETKRILESQVERNKVNPKRIVANNRSRENPVINYLNKKDGAWSWSPDVFVIEEKKYKGAKENIIGMHDGYVVVKDSNKPVGALSLVYNTSEKRLGIFMNKIVVLHEKSSDFETKLRGIAGSNVDYVSGVYFIESDNLAVALNTLAIIQSSISAVKSDLDVNYAIQRAN